MCLDLNEVSSHVMFVDSIGPDNKLDRIPSAAKKTTYLHNLKEWYNNLQLFINNVVYIFTSSTTSRSNNIDGKRHTSKFMNIKDIHNVKKLIVIGKKSRLP